MEEDRCGLNTDKVNLNIVLFEAVLQDYYACLEEVLILFDNLGWHRFKALMHSCKCDFSLHPVFVLAFIKNDRLVLSE